MLSLLSERGITFSFPQHAELVNLNAAKLAKIKPQMIYAHRTPLLHSLQGLIGHLDFDRLAHHKRHGSFMASPSSTAAYLMQASVWDDECEAYLGEVLAQSERQGRGSVPCAWPTTFFELSWIICNLRDGGFRLDELHTASLDKIRSLLEDGIEAGKGVIGFALNVGEDADDSAKVLSALSHLGVRKSIAPLRKAFELAGHFQCYPYERNPSITVHCNIFSALLDVGTRGADFKDVHEPVFKAARFISEAWSTAKGEILDKWHESPYYVLLLIAQSPLLRSEGHFADFPESIVQTTLFEVLVRILQAQISHGSWVSCEETAYALLALSRLGSLPFSFVSIKHETIQQAVRSGRDFLLPTSTGERDTGDKAYLWIDNINYRIPPLCYSYVLATLQATVTPV